MKKKIPLYAYSSHTHNSDVVHRKKITVQVQCISGNSSYRYRSNWLKYFSKSKRKNSAHWTPSVHSIWRFCHAIPFDLKRKLYFCNLFSCVCACMSADSVVVFVLIEVMTSSSSTNERPSINLSVCNNAFTLQHRKTSAIFSPYKKHNKNHW